MKKYSSFLSLFFLITIFSSPVFSQDIKHDILPSKSNVKWEARKVTGKHNGLIHVKNGSIMTAEDKLSGGTLFIDMNSIECLDLEDPESNKKLVTHLKSEDFFNTRTYGTSVVKIYKIDDLEGNDEYNLLINAGLTIKGITNKIQFPAFFEKKNQRIYLSGNMTVDRTLYDIRYGSGKFFDNLGDNLIYDEFTIDFKVAASPPEEN